MKESQGKQIFIKDQTDVITKVAYFNYFLLVTFLC